MSIVILIIGILAIALGHGWYARTINRNIIQPNDKKATPAKMYIDLMPGSLYAQASQAALTRRKRRNLGN